jgi:hypothetical protein
MVVQNDSISCLSFHAEVVAAPWLKNDCGLLEVQYNHFPTVLGNVT